jgi:hypothetical protein
MSEGEGVERDGGERDNTTFAVGMCPDGVPYSRFFFPSFLFAPFFGSSAMPSSSSGDFPSDSGALNCRHGRGLPIGLWGLKLSSR